MIDSVEKVMSEFGKGNCQLPVKIHVNTCLQTYINTMPAHWTYTRFADRFVCDDWNLVQTYLQDGKYTDGLPQEYQILGDIINGDALGRADENEFVITSSHGVALSDVAVGQMILEKAEKAGVGTMLTLMEEVDILR